METVIKGRPAVLMKHCAVMLCFLLLAVVTISFPLPADVLFPFCGVCTECEIVARTAKWATELRFVKLGRRSLMLVGKDKAPIATTTSGKIESKRAFSPCELWRSRLDREHVDLIKPL